MSVSCRFPDATKRLALWWRRVGFPDCSSRLSKYATAVRGVERVGVLTPLAKGATKPRLKYRHWLATAVQRALNHAPWMRFESPPSPTEPRDLPSQAWPSI